MGATTLAVAGHGALIAIEQDPTGSPGTFTTIAELNGDITYPELSRPETEVTPHQLNIDTWILGVPTRGPLTFSVNWIFDNATHDHLTGLTEAFFANETRGIRITGPGSPVSPADEWICSGAVQSINQTAPIRTGVRSSDISIRLSGCQIIDGVEFGA